MKRAGILGLLFCVVFVINGIAASTASARCAMSTEDVGNYKDISTSGECIEPSIFRIQLWVIVDSLNEASLGGGVDCAQESETGKGYATNGCTGEQTEGSGKWIKVSAPGWNVNGVGLTGTAALASTAESTEAAKLHFSSITVECKGKNLNVVSPEIEAPNKGAATSLTFNECKATEGPCELVGTQIGTLPLITETTREESFQGVKTILKPKTKSTFATISFAGSSCALASEVQPIAGKVTAILPNGYTERTSQEILANVTKASEELKVGSSVAELKDKALLKLASGKPWSFS